MGDLIFNYNTILVLFGATLMGFAAGQVGTYLYLRKTSLVTDAMAHATLPGLVLAFIIMTFLGLGEKNLVGLMLGAALSAAFGASIVSWMSSKRKIDRDTAIGAVLSSFFGLGVVLMTYAQTLTHAKIAGLESFLLGSVASMLLVDALTIVFLSCLAVIIVVVFHRQFVIVAFDPIFAKSHGIDPEKVDKWLIFIVLFILVFSLKIVGLILVISVFLTPPAAARFWVKTSYGMSFLSGVIGAVSAFLGVLISAFLPNAPTGPLIVLVGFGLFLISFIFAPTRGLFAKRIPAQKVQSNG